MLVFLAGIALLFSNCSLSKSSASLSQFGTLSLSSEPSGAKIFLNEKDTNRVTPALLSLPAGTFHLKLTNRSDESWEGNITIAPNETTTLHVRLQQTFIPPLPF